MIALSTMRKTTIVILILLPFLIFSQGYQKIDSKVRDYSNYTDLNTLSKKIINDFNSDEARVRALYTWLILNIKYYSQENYIFDPEIIISFSEYDRLRISRKKDLKKINKALLSKSANCYGFALIFKEVCDLLKIESSIIKGYAKIDSEIIETNQNYKNHAWNSVRINNEWKLIDIAWATYDNSSNRKTNHKLNDYYFFTKPSQLINNHFPADPNWQLIAEKVSKKDFFSSPILYAEYFNSDFKLVNSNQGVLKVTKENKYLIIEFKEISKKSLIQYVIDDNNLARSAYFKKKKNKPYTLKIKFNRINDSQITLFYKKRPLAGFKIDYIN